MLVLRVIKQGSSLIRAGGFKDSYRTSSGSLQSLQRRAVAKGYLFPQATQTKQGK
jgi:hypothetical protein